MSTNRESSDEAQAIHEAREKFVADWPKHSDGEPREGDRYATPAEAAAAWEEVQKKDRTINDVLGGPWTPDLQVVPPCKHCGRPRGEHASLRRGVANDEHWCPFGPDFGLDNRCFSKTEYFTP